MRPVPSRTTVDGSGTVAARGAKNIALVIGQGDIPDTVAGTVQLLDRRNEARILKFGHGSTKCPR
jgi:hypothetical protein